MNKLKLMILGFGIISMLSLSIISISQGDVEVAVGDTFNYKITEDTLNPAESLIMFTDILGNFSDLITEFDIDLDSSLYDDKLENVSFPKRGDIIVVTVVSLPTSTNYGEISLTLDNETEVVETGFIFGTPVVSTNWTFWDEKISHLAKLAENITEITISTNVYSNDDWFNATGTLDLQVPQEIKETGIDSLKLVVSFGYNKLNGVQNYMEIKIVSGITIGSQKTSVSQKYSWELTDEEPGENTNTDQVDSGPVPGFEFLAMLTGLTILSGHYFRRRK